MGVVTIVLCAIFFLRPTSLAGLSPFHVSVRRPIHGQAFPGSGQRHSQHGAVVLPIVLRTDRCFVILGAIGVWSSSKAATYAGIKDPQFVVIDEVAGQHLTLLLPLIPIALPNLHSHMDLSHVCDFFGAEPGELEILAVRVLVFPNIRHLEAVPAAAPRKPSGRLGHYGGRLGGRGLRRDPACAWRYTLS